MNPIQRLLHHLADRLDASNRHWINTLTCPLCGYDPYTCGCPPNPTNPTR